jgi:predicted Zn-dependent protease with MMP-like domain
VEDFIGKYVGVRASERRLQQGGVNPIPIYIVTELILMQPPKLDSAQASSKNTP